MKKIKILSLVTIIFLCFESKGQNFFGASLFGGFNLAQIHGDNLAGYNKLGLNTGIKTFVSVSDRFNGAIELLYSQKGSQAKLSFGSPSSIQFNNLNYAEIPIYIEIKDWYIEDEELYKMRGHIGVSYERLFSVKTANGSELDIDNFKENGLNLIIGGTFSFNKKFAFTTRYTHSLVSINSDLVPNKLTSLLWTLRLEYTL